MLRRALSDGIVTGLLLVGGVVLLCVLLDTGVRRCSELVFISGLVVIGLSSVWTVVGYHSPPGLLSVFRGDVEVYPSPRRDSLWMDRFMNPRNVWLTAGLFAVVVSFGMLFL